MIHFGLEGILPLLLYAAMFVACAASVFWRPSVSVYLVALTLPLQTGRSQLQQFPLGSQFLDILLFGTVLGLILRGHPLFPKGSPSRFLIFFAIFCYLSLWQGSLLLHAPWPVSINDPGLSDWKNYVEMFLLAWIAAGTLKEKRQVWILLLAMGLSVLIVNRAFYSIMNSRDLSHFSDQIRDAGPLGYAGVNGLAAFEAMVVSFLLGFATAFRQRLPKIALWLIIASCTYCLLFSFSRGGYLGLLVGIATVALLKSRWLLVAVVVILFSWQVVLPTSVRERIMMTTEGASEGQQFEPSAQDRLVLWYDALDLFKRNPVTGTGFDTYGSLERVGGYRDTHNYYIKVLTEMGVLGLFLYLTLLVKMLRSGLRLFRTAEDPFYRGIGLGFVAMLASIMAANLFGDRWTYQQLDGFLWLMLGCVIRGLIVLEKQPGASEAVPAASPALDEPQLAVA